MKTTSNVVQTLIRKKEQNIYLTISQSKISIFIYICCEEGTPDALFDFHSFHLTIRISWLLMSICTVCVY